ncbi:hypothetical protein DXG03_002628 [Asterophora parasitica]|uniref:Uncharacterized protein n=1 Tax=Asterophora parasitica TaxID=117018 RepID=A0A9P7GDD7_9AGAR|nr:hypothetical protein DXG03_002628 [Asterophora parasitica]
MGEPSTDLIALQQRFSTLLQEIRNSESDNSWVEVENVAQALANGLRSKGGPVDNHTVLGKTALPRTLTSLFTSALHGSGIPDDKFTSVVFELLRVAANICLDHNENRSRLLEAGFPQAITSLLEGYVELIPSPPHTNPLDLSDAHLKIIRTSIGALLNASLGYEPVKMRLISLEAPLTILKLSTAIYPTGYWTNASPDETNLDAPSEGSWGLRFGLSDWAWRAISELKDVKGESEAINKDEKFASNLIDADYENLQESCTLLESLSLDLEDIRLSLARGLNFPSEHSGVPCLAIVLDFIEHGTYPSTWNSPVFDNVEKERKQKAFNICKAALIKTVVEVAGESRNEDVLWDDSEPGQPGGPFVSRMVTWLKRYVHDMDATTAEGAPNAQSILDREDMKTSAQLVSPPHSLAPDLTSTHLLSPNTDIKVKHGVLGLLKHLAQASASSLVIHSALGRAGVIRRIAASGVWDEKTDAMAGFVQLSAIGVVKHIPTVDSQPSPIAAGSVNKEDLLENQRKRSAAIRTVLTPECASILATLVGRSGQYPLLINEGVVALSLLSTHKEGGLLVLDALMTSINVGEVTSLPDVGSDVGSAGDVGSTPPTTPSAHPRLNVPRHPLDMLIFTLKNVDNPVNFPVEVRVNVCSFFAQLARHTAGENLDRVKAAVRPVLETILITGTEEMLTKAAHRVLNTWAPTSST